MTFKVVLTSLLSEHSTVKDAKQAASKYKLKANDKIVVIKTEGDARGENSGGAKAVQHPERADKRGLGGGSARWNNTKGNSSVSRSDAGRHVHDDSNTPTNKTIKLGVKGSRKSGNEKNVKRRVK